MNQGLKDPSTIPPQQILCQREHISLRAVSIAAVYTVAVQQIKKCIEEKLWAHIQDKKPQTGLLPELLKTNESSL